MPDVFSSIQLSKLPTPLKLTISLTLVVLGIGYLIALLNLHLTYHLTDGKEGLTVDDLKEQWVPFPFLGEGISYQVVG